MILNEKNNIFYYQFPNLLDFPELNHGIFTRRNGHSQGTFQGLNTSLSVGDESNRVFMNRSAILSCMGAGEPVFLNQVHGKEVVLIPAERGHGSSDQSASPDVGDALVTNLKHRWLVVQVADCQAVLIFDSVNKVMANIHAGWRGSIQNIIGAAIRVMKNRFGSRPEEMVAGVGPSLGPCCAEFIHYKKEIPARFWSYKDHRDYFDFWSISRDQMIRAGIPAANIHISNICTKCHMDQFFSYRGEGTTGRFAAVIGMR